MLSPVSAKEKVKVKISTDKWLNGKGVIIIKLVDSKGNEIKSKGTLHYNITASNGDAKTDNNYNRSELYYNITASNGDYKWAYAPYKHLRLKYDPGTYNVKVKFDGDSKYKSASKTKEVTVKSIRSGFDAYTYYDNHNWGLNQNR